MKKLIIIITALAGCGMPAAFEDIPQKETVSGIEIIPGQAYCTEGDVLPLSVVNLLPDGTREKADCSQLQFRTGEHIAVNETGTEFTCIREGTDMLEAFRENYYSRSFIRIKKKQDYSHLRITEVMYNPAKEASEKEYIEIMNTGSFPVNIDGCIVIDGSSSSKGFLLYCAHEIEPGKRLTAAQSDEKFASAYGSHPDCLPFTFTLNNSGETIFLYSPEGILLDAVYICGGSVDFPAPSSWGAKSEKTAEGNAIKRQDPSSDTDSASDWIESPPSPGI